MGGVADAVEVPVTLAPLVPVVQGLVLAVLPHGGQLTARRNAWAGMASDAARARSRREADAALAVALAAAAVPADGRSLPGG